MTVAVTEIPLKISETSTTQLKRIKQLPREIFKTANNLNPDLMKKMFTSTQNAWVRPNVKLWSVPSWKCKSPNSNLFEIYKIKL